MKKTSYLFAAMMLAVVATTTIRPASPPVPILSPTPPSAPVLVPVPVPVPVPAPVVSSSVSACASALEENSIEV